MIRSLLCCLALTLGCATPFAPALADGQLGTLDHGHYTCGTPGDAGGPVISAIPALSFTIVAGSSYRSEGGGGTYLLTGDLLTFTRGPLKDKRFTRDKNGLWQEIDASAVRKGIRCARVSYP